MTPSVEDKGLELKLVIKDESKIFLIILIFLFKKKNWNSQITYIMVFLNKIDISISFCFSFFFLFPFQSYKEELAGGTYFFNSLPICIWHSRTVLRSNIQAVDSEIVSKCILFRCGDRFEPALPNSANEAAGIRLYLGNNGFFFKSTIGQEAHWPVSIHQGSTSFYFCVLYLPLFTSSIFQNNNFKIFLNAADIQKWKQLFKIIYYSPVTKYAYIHYFISFHYHHTL